MNLEVDLSVLLVVEAAGGWFFAIRTVQSD